MASAVATGNNNTSVEPAPVSAAAIEEAKSAVGIDLMGYRHTVDMFAVRHAMNQHGNSPREKARGQIGLTVADVKSIPDVIERPDVRVYGAKTPRGQPIVGSIKRLPDGSLLVAEEVRTGRKTLALTSMRKYPAAKDFDSIARTLLSNAQSDGEDLQIVSASPSRDTLQNIACPRTVAAGDALGQHDL